MENHIINNGGEHDGKQCTYTMCYSINPDVKDKCLGWCRQLMQESEGDRLWEILENYREYLNEQASEQNVRPLRAFINEEIGKFSITNH